MLRSRRAMPADLPPGWKVIYRLAGETDSITESYITKQHARDRYFTVKEFKGVEGVELRGPGNVLWFKDRFFEGNPGGMK